MSEWVKAIFMRIFLVATATFCAYWIWGTSAAGIFGVIMCVVVLVHDIYTENVTLAGPGERRAGKARDKRRNAQALKPPKSHHAH